MWWTNGCVKYAGNSRLCSDRFFSSRCCGFWYLGQYKAQKKIVRLQEMVERGMPKTPFNTPFWFGLSSLLGRRLFLGYYRFTRFLVSPLTGVPLP